MTLISLFIFLSLTFSFFTVAKILAVFHLNDFESYYSAVQQLFLKQNPYQLPLPGFPFIYPPPALFFLFPFGLLSYPLAEKLWTLFSLFCLIVSLRLLLRGLFPKATITSFLVVFGLTMISFPTRFSLGMGQVNFFILFLISLSFRFYRHQRFSLAGFFLAIAAVIKITPLLCLLFFLRKKTYPLVKTFLLSCFLFLLLAFLIFGSGLTKQYFLKVLPRLPAIGNQAYYNQALSGFLARLQVNDRLACWINYLILFLLLTISFFKTPARQQPFFSELGQFSFFLTVSLIAGGLTWQHHLVFLIIPFLALWGKAKKQHPSEPKTGWLVLAYFLVSANIKNPLAFSGLSLLFLSHGLYGTALVFLLAFI
ncbi:MAG: DUF2029 domain-containing protein [Candidatus Pacebacteria bacterium]|nr:DUF2029 domain-containing protein [Candidatus Paceibacterota bacterium]